MDDDRQLLRQFVEYNSQEAFAALTKRYLGLVYSVCRRETDNPETAEDVTQAVFLILAKKAPTLRRNVVLSGWLFQTARFAAKNARTQETRRMAYEQKAAEEMEQQASLKDADWAEIEPLLNQSLAALKEGERECVFLRYFQEMSFAETGAALGLTEEAARKRLTRALEKMRRFFGKEGVMIPGAALAVLLSAHAAKAVPATCQAKIGLITHGVLAGHLSLSLTGSHAYQLSEGVLKAMKIAQIKAVVGLTTVAVIGLTTYSVANKIVLPIKAARHVAPVIDTPPPGHALSLVSGKTLTAVQIAAHCQDAYRTLQTYTGNADVSSQAMTIADGKISKYHTSATIRFARPVKIHVDGTTMSGYPFAYVSDGAVTEERNNLGSWKKVTNAEAAIAAATGIAQSAGTTIPALLLGTNWGNPFTPEYDMQVREDNVAGHSCYVVTSSLASATQPQRATFWIDEKTFLLRRYVRDASGRAFSVRIGGVNHEIPAIRSHNDERFTNERLNETIPDSAFTLPPSQ